MGIADRDYAQPPGTGGGGFGGGFGGGGLGNPRHWSFNTWLIAVNVSLFVVGSLIGATLQAPLGVPVQQYALAGADLRDAEVADAPLTLETLRVDDRSVRAVVRPLVDQNGQQIGWQSYRTFADPFGAYGHFSTYLGFFRFELWRLVTFQFLHANLLHLLFNMMGLFFFGALVERHLGSRRLYAAYYLTCGIFGALLYLLLNVLGYFAPMGGSVLGFLDVDLDTPLIGASAGVFGVLMASAYIAPNATMLIFGLIPLKVRTGAYIFVGIAFLNLIMGGDNAGGDAAHLGGAAAGFFFIRRPKLLIGFFDEILGSDDKRGRSARVVKKPEARRAKERPGRAARANDRDRARMDELLAKVGTQGLHALSDKERRELDEISKRLGD